MQRLALSQLRSGQLHFLGEYQRRINLSSSAICPECEYHQYTDWDLFRCSVHPTAHASWPRGPLETPCLLFTKRSSFFLFFSFSSLLPSDPLLHPPPPDSLSCLRAPTMSLCLIITSLPLFLPLPLFAVSTLPSPCSSTTSTSPKCILGMDFDNSPNDG